MWVKTLKRERGWSAYGARFNQVLNQKGLDALLQLCRARWERKDQLWDATQLLGWFGSDQDSLRLVHWNCQKGLLWDTDFNLSPTPVNMRWRPMQDLKPLFPSLAWNHPPADIRASWRKCNFYSQSGEKEVDLWSEIWLKSSHFRESSPSHRQPGQPTVMWLPWLTASRLPKTQIGPIWKRTLWRKVKPPGCPKYRSVQPAFSFKEMNQFGTGCWYAEPHIPQEWNQKHILW